MFRELNTVYSKNHTKSINTLCGKNTELLNVKGGGACSYHCALKRGNETIVIVTVE
jgi:hypothetical protein